MSVQSGLFFSFFSGGGVEISGSVRKLIQVCMCLERTVPVPMTMTMTMMSGPKVTDG